MSPQRLKIAAIAQFAGVVLCLPALILPDVLSGWPVVASFIGIAALPFVGFLIARRPWARTPLDIPAGLFLGLSIANLFTSLDRTATFPHVAKTVAGIALFYGLVGLIFETRWLQLTTWSVLLVALGLIPFVLLGVQWSGDKFSWLPWAPADVIPRLFRPFWKPADYAGFNPNMAGGVLAMVLPMPLAIAAIGQRGRAAGSWVLRVLSGLVALGIATTLILTQSRGAVLATLGAAAVMAAAVNWRWLAAAAPVLIAGALALQSAGMTPPPSWDLASDTESALNSAAGRVELWSRAWAVAGDFPLTGVGMGLFSQVVPLSYPTFRIPVTGQFDHAHNIYLNTAAEMGLPGMIALLATLIGLGVLTWRAARQAAHARMPAAPLAVGSLGSVAVLCIHGITDAITYYARAHIIAWALLGVAAGTALWALHSVRDQ